MTDWVTDSEDSEKDVYIAAWRRMIDWFKNEPELSNPTFIRIGDCNALWDARSGEMPEGTEITGCVLPRLAVGITKAGSIVGLFGYSVQT